MPTEKASAEIERRVTAWHEAGHVVATLISRHFEVNDPAVDFRSNPRGKAFAGVKKLSGPAPPTVAEAKELYAIALGGRIAEDTLEAWSRQAEGRAIYPDDAGASADLAWARGLVAHHQFDEELLEEEARNRLAEHLEVVVELGDRWWRSKATQVSRSELLAIPVVAALHARHPKAKPDPAPAANEPATPPSATTTARGLWARLLRFLRVR